MRGFFCWYDIFLLFLHSFIFNGSINGFVLWKRIKELKQSTLLFFFHIF